MQFSKGKVIFQLSSAGVLVIVGIIVFITGGGSSYDASDFIQPPPPAITSAPVQRTNAPTQVTEPPPDDTQTQPLVQNTEPPSVTDEPGDGVSTTPADVITQPVVTTSAPPQQTRLDLGAFNHFGTRNQSGWVARPGAAFSVADFTNFRYLVLELSPLPAGVTTPNLTFVWRSVPDDFHWEQRNFSITNLTNNELRIDMRNIANASDFNSRRSELEILMFIGELEWNRAPLRAAYFTN
jgi:hypothetical protein